MCERMEMERKICSRVQIRLRLLYWGQSELSPLVSNLFELVCYKHCHTVCTLSAGRVEGVIY